MINISIWGVLAAAASAMLIGTIWYSPALFGQAWQKGIGLDDKTMKAKVGPAMITPQPTHLSAVQGATEERPEAYFRYDKDAPQRGNAGMRQMRRL